MAEMFYKVVMPKNLFSSKKIWWLAAIYALLTGIYAWWSYGLTTPNLVLSTNSIYWQWQVWMWENIFNNRPLRSIIFGALMIMIFGIYVLLARQINRLVIDKKIRAKKFALILIIAALPLFFSYNALSADVFNYIFNAKMVLELQADPHLQVAQDFPGEPLLRFMHNSHTPAPYGRLFTLITLPFYWLGADKFVLQWLAMRMMNLGALMLSGILMWKMWRREKYFSSSPVWILLNPLILIEFISNSHNDWWMLLPALAAFYLIRSPKKTWWKILLSALFLLASTQIKFATVVLLPFWLYCLIAGQSWWVKFVAKLSLKKFNDWVEKYFFDLMAIAMFVPLLTPRAQFFHPWYLSWSLAWWPLCRARWLKYTFLCLSLSAMLRYLVYLWLGDYTVGLAVGEVVITFAGAAVFGLAIYLVKHLSSVKKA